MHTGRIGGCLCYCWDVLLLDAAANLPSHPFYLFMRMCTHIHMTEALLLMCF